ncbi:MAG: hypothetical protein ACKVT0_22670 [Planctomycetaceae bacterium]
MPTQPNSNLPSKSPKPISPKSLISHTTILILSIFLLGMESGHWQTTGPNPYILGISMFGLVAWLGLGHLSHVRDQRESKRALDQAISQIENRVDRHIRINSPQGSNRPADVNPPQYAVSGNSKS